MRSRQDKPVHVGPAWRVILADLGLDEQTILCRAGLPSTLFQGGGTYIAVDELYALYDAIEAENDDPTIPLQGGRVVSIELFDPALFAAICSPDLNTAASRLGQFKRLVGAFNLDVDVGAEVTTIHYQCKHRPDIHRILGLTELVFLVAFTRRATRHQIVPRLVTVQQLPTDLEPYETFFGCSLVQHDTCSVVFTAENASRPFLTHNAHVWCAFEPNLRQRMAEASENRAMGEQVESALFKLLPSGRTQMRDVAKELGVGSRTLQRRLAEEGVTWLELLNQTRERLARHYLGTTQLSPAQISFLLGFEEPNSLFRAFQRWTGTTPESWRAEAQGLD